MLGESLDAEMAEMAKKELSSLKRKVELEDKIKFLLLPEDPNDGKNIIMEIHGAAGGDKLPLCRRPLNMYQKCRVTRLACRSDGCQRYRYRWI